MDVRPAGMTPEDVAYMRERVEFWAHRAGLLEGVLREHLPLFHRMTRRVAPGMRDDGMVGLWYRHHEGVDDHHVCVGCQIAALLAQPVVEEGNGRG